MVIIIINYILPIFMTLGYINDIIKNIIIYDIVLD